jgi:hypothetical protein
VQVAVAAAARRYCDLAVQVAAEAGDFASEVDREEQQGELLVAEAEAQEERGWSRPPPPRSVEVPVPPVDASVQWCWGQQAFGRELVVAGLV